jgi:signal transduction histidine kinase
MSLFKNSLLIIATAGTLTGVVLLFLFYLCYKYCKLKRHNNDVLNLNQDIKKNLAEVIVQRNILEEKNIKLERLHRELLETSKSLQRLVKKRTIALKEQNKRFEDYAFITAHKVRAPLARVLGLTHLLKIDVSPADQQLLLGHLKKASGELDGVIRSLSLSIHQALSAYNVEESDLNDSDQHPDS